jgi:hypothetical protein
MTEATPTHDELVAALGLAYEALSGVGEQTEAASAAAYDVLVREAICTSTDPTNHQGDTCPIHEQHDALVAALTLVAYRYESGDIGDLVNDMPEIEAALRTAR